MINKLRIAAFASCLGVFTTYAEVNINGFASIVSGKAIGSTLDSAQSESGYDHDIDFKKGSLFALQVSSDLGNGLGVTAQILSRGDDEWDPNFEWAYVSYDASDNLRFLAGRQRVPFYMYSDFLDVSYAYPWIEPPIGVYDVLFDTFDGLGAIYNFQTGNADHTLHAILGSNTDKQDILVAGVFETVNTEFENLYGISYTFNQEWLTLRTAYFETDLQVPIANPFYSNTSASWRALGRTDIATNIEVLDDKGKFFEIGFNVDYNDIIFTGEYTNLKLEGTPFNDEESFYLMAGFRINEFTPHITFGVDNDFAKNDILSGNLSGVPAQLIAVTNGITVGTSEKSSYYTLGLRWDFHESAALKFEYTDYDEDDKPEEDYQLIRAALVTVF